MAVHFFDMSVFHVRRKDREITNPHEMHQVLKTTKYVTIALCLNNQPYLVSLSHGYDEAKNSLYFHCASEGKKLVYAQANPLVWGQALLDYGVTDKCDYVYTSVHFSGKLFFITELTEKWHALETIIHQSSKTPHEKLSAVKPEKLAKIAMGQINITTMTGKKHQALP
ncbi:MAG: pyridoxamine 5'-phosphate oxidase family protein [Nitrososphaerota archaeon]|nr:pyridoxamine 5'-phosphate oxidase family protein [Nitrososphaerota archaeon]